KGPELLVEPVLAGRGQSGDRAAVEGAAQGDDRRPGRVLGRPVLARDLDGALVGLGPGIAEEDGVHPRPRAELAGQGQGLAALVVIGYVDEARGLRGDRRREGGMAMAEAVDAYAAREIEVFPPVVGLERRAR